MASQSELTQELQEELICSICSDYFTDPVSIECGHSFCHSCLLRSWKEASSRFSCPECRSVSQLRDFQVNLPLAKLAKKLRLDCFQYPRGLGKCEVHQKVQKLFCEDDQSPVCVSCSQNKDHEAHRLQCIDEAAENFREKFQETLTDLWRKTENVDQQMAYESKKLSFMEKEIEIQKHNIVSEFQKLEQFLDEEKNFFFLCLKTQGRTNFEALRKTERALSHHSQELWKRITELEEECKKPDVDLLQDMKGMLNRNETVLQEQIESFTVNISTFSISGIVERLPNFKVDITLDVKTAEPGFIISEDLKSMGYAGVQEKSPNNSGRFKDFALVFAVQSFISRKCYWEVEIQNNVSCCIGICKESSDFQDFTRLIITQENHFYHLYAMAQNDLYYHARAKHWHLSVSSLKVGIFLDYDRGEVSFYHVTYRSLIYTFPTTIFSGSIKPFFCLSKNILRNDYCLRICH